jgi:D-alanyl-D-alanine carboxypeptidase
MNRSIHGHARGRAASVVVSATIALSAFLAFGSSASATPIIQAQRGASYDMKNNKLLYDKFASPVAAAMASTTKAMTFAVTLDALNYNKVELTDTFQIGTYAANIGGSSFMGSQALDGDETMTLEDALYALALSANDVTTAVAEFVANAVNHNLKATGGSPFESWLLEDEFVDLMNAKAAAWGMSNTHYVDPTGLDMPGHVTSSVDLVKLWDGLDINLYTKQFLGVRSGTMNVIDPDGALPYVGICNGTQAPLIRCPFTKGYGYYPGIDADKNGGTPNCIQCLVAGATRLGRPVAAAVQQSPNSGADVAELFRDAYDGIFTPEVKTKVISSEAKAHAITIGDVDGVKYDQIAVTAQLAGGELKLTTWATCHCGSLDELSETSVPAPTAVAVEVAAVRLGMVATLVRQSSGDVELQTWSIANDDTGTIKPIEAVPLGSGTSQAITSLGYWKAQNPDKETAAVAVRTPFGYYRVTLVQIAPDGTIGTAGVWQSPYPIADGISLASDSGALLKPYVRPMLVAAVRTPSGNLRLTSFEVYAPAGYIEWQNDADTVTGSSVGLSWLNGGSYATSMVTTKGNVRVSFWRIDREGNIYLKNDTGDRPRPALATGVASIGFGTDEGAFTVARAPGGNLLLDVWENDERGEYQGKPFLRLAGNDFDAGLGGSPRVVRRPTLTSAGEFITSKINSAGNLELATWWVGRL